jgi:superfamily II DNA or RNA helicase
MRNYQLAIVDEVIDALAAGELRMMLALSTGAGKTHIARELIERLGRPGEQILFVVDRLVLVEQAMNVFRNYGFNVGIIQAENSRYSPADDVIVASVQSLPSRHMPPGIKLAFFDEAHLLHKPHRQILEGARHLPIIGLSATPLRKGLGQYFNRLIRGPSIHDLTEQRYLVPVRAYSPGVEQLRLALASVTANKGDYQQADLSALFRNDAVIGDAISTYQQLGEKRPAIAFCVDQAHAKAVTAEFGAVGIRAAYILADTSQAERKALVADFEAGVIRVLVSVAVLSAGFDAPHASCAILLRPTLSRSLHIQQVGRVLRSLRDREDCEQIDDEGDPIKPDALILDHAGNCTRHGLPDDFVVPDLSDESHISVAGLRKSVDRLVTCVQCALVIPNDADSCPACGADRPAKRPNVEYLDGELLEHHQAQKQTAEERKAAKRRKPTDDEKKAFYLGYRFYCLAHGRKEGEAFYAYQEKYKVKPPWAWRELEPVPPSQDVLRYIQHRNIRYSKRRKRSGEKHTESKDCQPGDNASDSSRKASTKTE